MRSNRKRRRPDIYSSDKKDAAAPSRKTPNERYPDFFLKHQIPRLKELKTKRNDDKSKKQSDEQLLRTANDLEHRFRKSGYFVHKQIGVNKQMEKTTPYLYHSTEFTK